MEARPKRHFRRCRKAQLLLLVLVFLLDVSSSDASANYWTCPVLNINDSVTCQCDRPHSLQCRIEPRPANDHDDASQQTAALATIATNVRSLPSDNRVQVLELLLDKLSDVPDGIFDGTGLNALVIDQSRLTAVTAEGLRGLSSSLEALAITSGALRAVPAAALATLPLLTKVNLSGNGIGVISDTDFRSLAGLEEVNMSENNVSNASAFRHNRKLRKLVLDQNRMEGAGGFAASVGDDVTFPVLIELSLARNRYRGSFRAHWLPEMTALVELNLAGNVVDRVEPGALASCRRLQRLDLSHNRIASLANGAFAGTSNLSVLVLSHNRLQGWSPEAFVGLTSLRELRLNDNYLTAVDGSLFLPLSALRYLDLKDNSIRFIHHRTFVNNKGLQALDLEDNPLTCDCKLRGFSTWLRQTPRLTASQKRLATCEVPSSLHGQALLNVPPDRLTCTADDTPPGMFERMQREEKQQRRRQGSRTTATASPPILFDAEITSGLQLLDYSYDNNGFLTLQWQAGPEWWPLVCQAVFIHEESRSHRSSLRNKILTGCDDPPTVAQPHLLQVRLPDVEFRQGATYRLCLAAVHLRTLVIGCSEPLRLDADHGLLMATSDTDGSGKGDPLTVIRPRMGEEENGDGSQRTQDGDRGSGQKNSDNRKQDGGHRREKQAADHQSENHEEKQHSDKGKNKQDGDSNKENKDRKENRGGDRERENQDDVLRRRNQDGGHRLRQQNDSQDEDAVQRRDHEDADSRKRNRDDDRQQPERGDRGEGPPVISANMTGFTSVRVSWRFSRDVQLPESCQLDLRLMNHEREVDRKRTNCTKPYITFSGLDALHNDYNVCAELVDGPDHQSSSASSSSSSHQQHRSCEKVRKSFPEDHQNNTLKTLGAVFLFVFVVGVVAVIMQQLMQRCCAEPAPKSIGLMKSCRSSTQYRVLYHQPNIERPLVTAA